MLGIGAGAVTEVPRPADDRTVGVAGGISEVRGQFCHRRREAGSRRLVGDCRRKDNVGDLLRGVAALGIADLVLVERDVQAARSDWARTIEHGPAAISAIQGRRADNRDARRCGCRQRVVEWWRVGHTPDNVTTNSRGKVDAPHTAAAALDDDISDRLVIARDVRILAHMLADSERR